jgi:hypothetical protein
MNKPIVLQSSLAAVLLTIEDFHSHPMIPRTARVTIGYEF